MHLQKTAILSFLLLALAACEKSPPQPVLLKPKDSPESKLGERLFRDERFSEYFLRASHGNVNARLGEGEPVLQKMTGPRGTFKGAFNRQAMSCVACHMVDDAVAIPGAGTRTYADFSVRSPIPDRGDRKTTTVRNSPALVNASIPREHFFLHFDAEFSTIEDLVIGSFTGRNFGWLASEKDLALKNIVNVIRQDSGDGLLASKFGALSYARHFQGLTPNSPNGFQISQEYRLEVAKADDQMILDQVAKMVAVYLRTLEFSKDAEGKYNGSPYDVFLQKNHLPRSPEAGESDIEYAGRLAWGIAQLGRPEFVGEADGAFETHAQEFVFGPEELLGLQTFLATSKLSRKKAPGFDRVGNCVACHSPPHFTDFKFHNTGATQDEYDSIHGRGAFAQISMPTWRERLDHPERYFGSHGQFMSVPTKGNPGFTDLGLWNAIGNPGLAKIQTPLISLFCELQGTCESQDFWPRTVALFKTPGLRDLGHSEPYLHTGQKRSLEQVLDFYLQVSELARSGGLRNPDLEILNIHLELQDIEPVSAFLRSLNEDYD